MGWQKKKGLSFDPDLDHNPDCPIGNPAITQHIMSKHCDIFRIGLKWYKEQLIKYMGWSGFFTWLSKSGI